MKARLIILIAMMLSVLLAACGGDTEQSAADKGIAVVTVKSELREVQTSLHSIGRLVSRNAPLLSAEVGARVIEVLADEGDTVEAGQLLVRLDTTVFELARREAQAAIRGYEVSISNEQRRVERYRNLQNTSALSQESLDDAEAKLESSRAAKAAAEARLSIAEDQLSKAELVSPVDGVIERRHVSVGDFVRPADPVMSVTDTRSLRAELPFPETVGHQLMVGQRVILESLNQPGLEYETVISRIRPEVGELNRSLVALAEMENPGGWRPEATVEATVIIDSRDDSVVVPVVALVERPAGKVVYLLDETTGTVRQRVVEPGKRQNGWIEILSGLEPGVTVVADGSAYLTDGARVNVVEAAK